MKTFIEFLFVMLAGFFAATGAPLSAILFAVMAIYMRVAKIYEEVKLANIDSTTVISVDRRAQPRFGVLDPEYCQHSHAHMVGAREYCPECDSWLSEGKLTRAGLRDLDRPGGER